jgi:hypothetical protein
MKRQRKTSQLSRIVQPTFFFAAIVLGVFSGGLAAAKELTPMKTDGPRKKGEGHHYAKFQSAKRAEMIPLPAAS